MDTLPQADIEQLAALKKKLNRLSKAALKGNASAQQQLDERYRASIPAGQISPRYFAAYYKLTANDVAAFERELRDFARDYREDGIQSVSINEYYEPGQLTDPEKYRSWSVIFTQLVVHKKGERKLGEHYVPNMGAHFTVSAHSVDYPLLHKVDSVMDMARPFVAAWIEWCKSLWDAVPATSQQAQKSADNEQQRKRPGNPGLPHDELIYRLAKAQERNEIKAAQPEMTEREIAQHISWNKGTNLSGIKLLEDARHRLERFDSDDPDGILSEVTTYRRKEKKKTT